MPLVGLAKRVETIVTQDGREVLLPNAHPALKLLIHARDEAHRTAVGYNRQRRGQAMTRSILDDVPGVGPKRRDALLARFSSIDQLRESSVAELAGIPGVGPVAAAAVKAYFEPGARRAVDDTSADVGDPSEVDDAADVRPEG